MPRIYEGMFLLDNQVVRQDWQQAKTIVTGLLEKHGGTVHTARRWDERRLAYPIKKRNRATFLLTYSEIPNEGIEALRRDLEINEEVLRYLFLSVDEIPEGETDLASAEKSEDFVVPTPPADDAIDPEPEEESSEDGEGAARKPADGDAPKPAEGDAPKTADGDAPKAAEGDAPKAAEGDAPKAAEGDAPKAAEGDAPKAAEVDASPAGETPAAEAAETTTQEG